MEKKKREESKKEETKPSKEGLAFGIFKEGNYYYIAEISYDEVLKKPLQMKTIKVSSNIVKAEMKFKKLVVDNKLFERKRNK